MLREGHIKTVSVGYQVLSMDMVSKDKKSGLATYRCRWMPYEVSTEPIPADHDVGFGRSRGVPDVDLVEFTIEEPVSEGERTMSVEAGTPPAAIERPAKGTETREAPAVTASAPAVVVTKDRGAEAAEIMDMAQATAAVLASADRRTATLTGESIDVLEYEGVGLVLLNVSDLKCYVRVVGTVAGTSPSFDFGVDFIGITKVG